MFIKEAEFSDGKKYIIGVEVSRIKGSKCLRCSKYGQNVDHEMFGKFLCNRCCNVMNHFRSDIEQDNREFLPPGLREISLEEFDKRYVPQLRNVV